ncbi:MAG: amino acid adenylation domain-containing protein [Bdellovibrionales bacterium]
MGNALKEKSNRVGGFNLDQVNDTATAFSSHLCLHQLIEKQAAKTPDRIAVTFDNEKLTYSELNSRANRLAHHLRDQGVRSESRVCIFLERSQDLVVAVLAVLKAGGAYVPLDPAYPASRTSYIIEDSGADLVLTAGPMRGQLQRGDKKAVLVDAFQDTRNANLEPITNPSNLAYVIYTSGSTGNPKGVEISHRSLVNFIESMMREPGIEQDDKLLAVTTLSFDISGLELFLPLSVGAQIIMVDQMTAADGMRLKEVIKASAPTIMQATPATWRMLFDAEWEGNKKLKVLCGGEPMPRMLANQLIHRCGSLWNMYGPTETTIWSTLHAVAAGQESIPIGKPIANTQVYVLDEKLGRLPVGEIGELYIGGVGLARGYHGKPDLTNERFIPNPFAEGRLYRTGDLARFREDGLLECHGRIDHQVKIRGFRIELGEIENVLSQVPSVKLAVVTVKEDPSGEKRLVAYIQPNSANGINESELRKVAQERLPAYMLPSVFARLDSVPYTPNGKIDRKMLPDPDWNAMGSESSAEPPNSPTEIKLAAIWKQILGLKEIGRKAEFMNIGGSSISLTRLSHRISEAFDVQIPLTTLHARASLAEMAREIDERMRDA